MPADSLAQGILNLVRLTFISTILCFPWGGADALWTEAATRATQQGHEVSAVVSPLVAAVHPCAALKAAGVRIMVRREHTGFHGHRAAWLRKLRGESAWLDKLVRTRPDLVVLSQGGLTDFLIEDGLLEALKAGGIPYAIICQANEGLPILDDATRARARAVLLGAQKLIFVSRHNLAAAERQIATRLPNSCVVQNPVRAVPSPPAWPDESELRLAVVGRMQAYDKGSDLLLEAVANALSKEAAWSLTFYGRGPSESLLRELADHYGVSARVRFAGFVEEKFAIWKENHLLVMPSRVEGCSLAMLEAMQHARPVLMSRVGGVEDWVEHGKTGFVCAPQDAVSLAATLAEAWKLRALWRQMGQAAMQSVRAKLDPDPGATLLRQLVG